MQTFGRYFLLAVLVLYVGLCGCQFMEQEFAQRQASKLQAERIQQAIQMCNASNLGGSTYSKSFNGAVTAKAQGWNNIGATGTASETISNNVNQTLQDFRTQFDVFDREITSNCVGYNTCWLNNQQNPEVCSELNQRWNDSAKEANALILSVSQITVSSSGQVISPPTPTRTPTPTPTPEPSGQALAHPSITSTPTPTPELSGQALAHPSITSTPTPTPNATVPRPLETGQRHPRQ